MLATPSSEWTRMSGPISTQNCLGLRSLTFYSLGLSFQRNSTARDQHNQNVVCKFGFACGRLQGYLFMDQAGLDSVIG